MNQLSEPVFTESDKEKINGVLYQAMFDEVIRLRKCSNRKERKEIRDFIMEAYRLFFEISSESDSRGIFQENNFLKN